MRNCRLFFVFLYVCFDRMCSVHTVARVVCRSHELPGVVCWRCRIHGPPREGTSVGPVEAVRRAVGVCVVVGAWRVWGEGEG